MPLPPIITTVNTQMPLPPIVTTVNTRILPTPSVSLPTIPTLSRIPTPSSTPSRISTPILTPLDESEVLTPFNIKKPITDPLDNIKKPRTDPLDNIKSSSKVSYDDNNGDIDDDSLYNYEFYNPGPGTRTAIIAMERDVKDSYDNINYLQKKLLDTRNYDEYNKIIDNIDQAKKNIPKKDKELYYLKMGLIKKKKTNKKEPTKKIRIGEGRPLYSPERRKADFDIEEMLLEIDNDKISNLSKKLKNKLSADEYNGIIDDINKIDKYRKERIEKIKKIKENIFKKGKEDKNEKGNIKKVDVDKIMELFYPPEQRIANFEEEDKS